jgi:hypothetical protein
MRNARRLKVPQQILLKQTCHQSLTWSQQLSKALTSWPAVGKIAPLDDHDSLWGIYRTIPAETKRTRVQSAPRPGKQIKNKALF